MSDRRLAVVGATGAVGRTMIRVLEERSFPISDLRLLASARTAGQKVATHWGEVVVEDLSEADPSGIDLALFSAGADRSRSFAPAFVAAGAIVIDNSSAFRQDPTVPLIVAGVNDSAATGHQGLIANPNCTTMTLMMGLAPLHRGAGLRHLVATSYQSVSGAGQRGIDELTHQIEQLGKDPRLLVEGGWDDPGAEVFPRPIGWNVIPHAGNLGEGGYTDEEWKLVNETRKILDVPQATIEPTCVRVSVMVGHGVAATAYFHRPLPLEEAVSMLTAAPGIELWTEVAPTPLDCAGRDEVLVGRVRPTIGELGGVSFWAVGDNLRKGAATNAVQIAELLS
ncbi:MAG TPA: aspartate-semialdehyde dehydrogenase [Acidimicrobiia bacterium]|nr:aspartate-semialdehyde dehydrogenase [Acidimicrobiia bacterium]